MPMQKQLLLRHGTFFLNQVTRHCSICEACGICYNGFNYTESGRGIDVRCASISEPFVHQSHPHPLFYTTPKGVCSACNKENNYVVKCVEDNCGYILDFKCALLPYEVKHRVDDHFLSLCYGENASGKYQSVGLFLVPEFVNVEEEQELLAVVDTRPWIGLAKWRVQHYGYEFCYGTRNVDTKKKLGELPSFVSTILERISLFPNLGNDPASLSLDQLTVNEYPSGVGLSPHIDTHSAFEDCIFSLSLAGPCIMEFRRYSVSTWKVASTTDAEKSSNSSCIKKALYLPPRSMLLLSGEARYAWNHYIPHHKIDKVKEKVIRRSPRRVSFTLRKVRNHPCRCE
ncbi:hypothetical protein AALP_AA1G321500 [Arabis alpina]|uniref:Fe2OG dioxygenase domain-containing protein n=1 Tax=Arabis alpina TaxID=50452 RepID=A0A087HS29_ARAAL|nr:hypothetical protein AALP_AA1G321500 [Arabis alpina]